VAFHPAGVTSYTDEGEIWRRGVKLGLLLYMLTILSCLHVLCFSLFCNYVYHLFIFYDLMCVCRILLKVYLLTLLTYLLQISYLSARVWNRKTVTNAMDRSVSTECFLCYYCCYVGKLDLHTASCIALLIERLLSIRVILP